MDPPLGVFWGRNSPGWVRTELQKGTQRLRKGQNSSQHTPKNASVELWGHSKDGREPHSPLGLQAEPGGAQTQENLPSRALGTLTAPRSR